MRYRPALITDSDREQYIEIQGTPERRHFWMPCSVYALHLRNPGLKCKAL